MPVYEYACKRHGVFEALRPMSEYDKPAPCPDCGDPAPRVLVTPPTLGARNRAAIRAGDINARASDSPKRSSQHGPGCGCCGGGSAKKGRTLHHPNGAKSFPGKRPWMIAH